MATSNNEKSGAGNPLSLVWLRRDLRLYDHAALAHAAAHRELVQPVFVLDTDILARFPNPGDRRVTLIVRTLVALHEQLKHQGAGLLVLHGRAVELVPRAAQALAAARLVAAWDAEPDAQARDRQVKGQLEGGVSFTLVKDHLLHGAADVLKADGTPFRVFTPYARAWRAKAAASGCMQERRTDGVRYAGYAATQHQALSAGLPLLDMERGEEAVLAALGYHVSESEWRPEQAEKRLHLFAKKKMNSYAAQRDLPGADGTSRLSPYLRFGVLSVRQCARIASAGEAEGSAGAACWMNELIWRDFYAMILAHFPETATQEFLAQYRGLNWRWHEADWQRFAAGQTGYPIVDAGIRELLTTGMMHNRVRMIVASFLTKDLLMDWRHGEAFFAQWLMDYDMASNIGGWQWAASVGTDAQPYFRIFNPVLQGQKFDPQGEYIRRFVPELAHLSVRAMHEPWKSARPACYPEPMVDHTAARHHVLTLFKAKS